MVGQLEQYFYSFGGNKDDSSVGDWNNYRKYYSTPSMLKTAPLANIYMAQANENWTPVTDVIFFEPDDRDGVRVRVRVRGVKKPICLELIAAVSICIFQNLIALLLINGDLKKFDSLFRLLPPCLTA